ncbi:MAG: glycosyltransferase [Acidobacteriota bacterium]|nr:glycosyltransferase [Acidobacteriota bacterium]
MTNEQAFISVIVPVYNGGRYLERCLDALVASSYPSYEVIVVDDASTDDSAEIARRKGVTLIEMPKQTGQSAGRNAAAERARGRILFFVDADVVVRPETISRVASDFNENPDIAALFGSYDDEPAEKNFLSQYKNLQHHFVHQQGNREASTFWTGCGAVRREVFQNLGGLNRDWRCVEDIEFGYRLRQAGHRILLDKELQVKHLKRWRLRSWLRADIFCRAVPWSKLILENRVVVKDLNLQTSDRISAALLGLSIALLLLSILKPQLLFIVPLLLAGIVILNRKFYGFFLRKRGPFFTALVFPAHLLYYFYSSVTFAICWANHLLRGKRAPSELVASPLNSNNGSGAGDLSMGGAPSAAAEAQRDAM